MRLIISCISVLLLLACTAPQKKASKAEYFSGVLNDGSKYEEIKDNLTRGDSVFGRWSAEAYPMTEPLLTTEIKERAIKNMEPEAKIKKEIEDNVGQFFRKKTCFMFVVRAVDIESAKFINWVVKFQDSIGVLSEIKLENVTGVSSVPSLAIGASGNKWSNASIGCLDKKMDLTKPFQVFMIPQFKYTYSEGEKAELSWTVENSTSNNVMK